MTDPAQPKPSAGAPAGTVDEFAHIPRRRSRHPLITLAGALLAFFLVFYGRRDLRYATTSSEPAELGSASVAFTSGKVIDDYENRYVRVAGAPDRESALELDTKGSWVFSQMFRILGTGDRLFVHRLENPLPPARAEADVFEGRLIRIDELPYADAIRAYFAKHVTATHYFGAPEFTRALAARAAGGPLSVVDRGGDKVLLAAEEPLAVEVVKPDEVQIGLPRSRLATEAEARAALEKRGGQIVTARGLVKAPAPASEGAANLLASAPTPPERWTFVVRFPEARRQAALDELGDIDRAVEIRDARETIATRASELSADAGALVVRPQGGQGGQGEQGGQRGSERKLAAGDVAAVHTMAPVVIPEGAFLLVEGDRPRDHVASILFSMVLVIFGVFNIVALVRNRRS